MDLICPICNSGNIIEKEKLFSCTEQKYNFETKINDGCDFLIWKNMFGTTLEFEDIRKLINGESITKKCVSQTGKKYDGILTFDKNTQKIMLSFPDRTEEKTDKNGISEFAKGYKKDGKIVWKTISQKEISYDEAVKLFNGESIRKENMISQSGNEFSANIILNDEGKIEMIFDN